MHEHILYGQPGWEGDQSVAPFDRESIVGAAVETLKQLGSLGLETYVDATPNDGGRAPELYREISEKAGVHIVCATGYFNEEAGMPSYWKFRSALADVVSEMSELFVREIAVGIRDTGIKAGVIKVSSGKDRISDYERKVFQAAAVAQRETGVPILTHTEQGTMGPDQARLLIEFGADPARIQVGHMSDNVHRDYQLGVIDQGAYAAWDRMGLQVLMGCPTDEARYPLLVDLIKSGHADQLMLSHDYVIRFPGRPFGIPKDFQPLIAGWHPSNLFQSVIPRLKREGVSDDQIDTIIKRNPRRIFEAARAPTSGVARETRGRENISPLSS
jgi:phosphotriesterase-related protein